MIQTVKHNEQARKEYRFMSGLVMDAREEGIQQGKSLGLVEGEARGSRQKALETARLMKAEKLAFDLIAKVTGLDEKTIGSL